VFNTRQCKSESGCGGKRARTPREGEGEGRRTREREQRYFQMGVHCNNTTCPDNKNDFYIIDSCLYAITHSYTHGKGWLSATKNPHNITITIALGLDLSWSRFCFLPPFLPSPSSVFLSLALQWSCSYFCLSLLSLPFPPFSHPPPPPFSLTHHLPTSLSVSLYSPSQRQPWSRHRH